MPYQLDANDLARLRLAAEEAAWLQSRGYQADEVTTFVARRRELSSSEQTLLVRAAGGNAHVKHHIARELDPEDVAKRPLRIDAISLIATVEAALAGDALLETQAGVLIDPGWRRADYQPSPRLGAAIGRLVDALASLRPKAVRWLVDEGSTAPAVSEALAAHQKIGRAKSEVAVVADAPGELSGAAFVASSDPIVLDTVGTWVNVTALALASVDGAPRLRLHPE
jgi:hypothetical protein